MEVSEHNHETELSNCSVSETDITLNSLENETILERLITAIGSSFESTNDNEDDHLSTAESFDLDVRACAEPSLPTSPSISVCSFIEDYEIYDFKNKGIDQNVTYNIRGDIESFDMIGSMNRVRVIDSNECLDSLSNAQLQPVHFNPVYYLGIEQKEFEWLDCHSDDSDSDDDVRTAELGPAFGELSSYLREEF